MDDAAPDGYEWVCRVCGKRSSDRNGEFYITEGWDASCMLNAVLVAEEHRTLDDHGICASIDGAVYNSLAHLLMAKGGSL
jgi:hypothetical protein